MRRLVLVSSLALAVSACSQQAAAPAAQNAPAAQTPAPATAPPALIPRDVLFGNPERSGVQLSPDGKTLSWLAPLDGVLNIWVAPADAPDKARAVTHDSGRGIRSYFWSFLPNTLLYMRDSGGDEDFHLFALDIAAGGNGRDLSAFAKTRARVVAASPKHPESILVGMNDRDAQWHDLYRVDLASGKRTLLQQNTQQIGEYLADDDYQVRLATRSREDGGEDLLQPDGKGGWQKREEIPFEDTLTTAPSGFTADGKTLYFLDSRQRDTSALYALDVASGTRKLLFEDARADVGGTLTDPRSGVVQAVESNYLRPEWKVLDPAIAADIEQLQAIGPGEISVPSRTQDDRTWIVAYSAADAPATFYRYDRAASGAGKLTKLFAARPALEGQPLVPQWPQEIRSRDGLTLVSYLTLPREADANGDGKADKPVPLVLFVHGGPWARDDYGYSGYNQWLANRGYAVLQVNYRGSTGFGKRFTNAGDGEWAGKMHDDLLDAVQWAVQQGVTTKDQVAIMGGSYGGYATLVGLSFTPDTFKCGVDIVGPSNLNTLLSTIPPYWKSGFEQMARRIGDPRTEAGKQLLAERSPLSRADRIARPLLIGQGANDPRVKQAEADQIVDALKAKQIPVTYVLFPDEGHGFARPENGKAFNAVSEAFLGKCLGGRVQPFGQDLVGSSLSVPDGAAQVPGLEDALKSHTQSVRK